MKLFSQMDDIFSIDINSDSTFALLYEAQKQGHEIYYYLPDDLIIKGNEVSAYIHKIKLQNLDLGKMEEKPKNSQGVAVENTTSKTNKSSFCVSPKNKIGDYCRIIESKITNLEEADIILFRQDPPFNIKYITSSYALEKVKNKVLIVNNPTEIRNCPEKIFVTDFAEFSPPTIITSNLQAVQSFKEEHKDIIIKPLYGNGGEGVLYLKEEDNNLEVLHEMMLRIYKSPYIAQKYLKEVKNGDKRILLLDGEPIGALNRISKSGSVRTNLHVGGTPAKTELTNREKEICKKIGLELKKRGLIFVGIDVIGDYVTEINVTSPTCIQEISKFNNVNLAEIIWKYLEKKVNTTAFP